jgi:hypothetical protein
MKVIEEQLLNFVREKFPDVYAAFLTGSAVDEYFNEESDYDVYIITSTRDYVFNESFVYNEMKVQAIHLPLAKIDEILWYDTFSRTGIHLNSFQKGKILLDKGDYLVNLISYCQMIFNSGPPQCSYNDLKSHKISVLSLVSDLIANNHEEEKIILSHELYKAFIKFYLDYHGHWNSKNKHLARQMKNSNPHLSKLLVNEIRDFHNTLNPKKLLKLINRELSSIGDIDNGYSQYPGLINVKSNYLVLNVTVRTGFYELNNSILNRALNLIPAVNSCFVFRSRPLGDDDSIDECLYLVLHAQNEIEINKKIIPMIEKNSPFKDFPNVRIHFPVNFDFDLFLGGKELLDPIFKFFSLISIDYSSILKNENDSIAYSFHFIRIFKKTLFYGDENIWIGFLNFINNSWLPRAYDNKKIHSVSGLIQAKEMLLETFRGQFAHQEATLEKLLNNNVELNRDGTIQIELKNLKSLIKSNGVVKAHQKHPMNIKKYEVIPEWVIYRNMLDYILGIFMYKESQKPYLIYTLIKLAHQHN